MIEDICMELFEAQNFLACGLPEKICQANNHYFVNGFLVSKETVVLRRWERSKQKFGFMKRVDKG